MVLQETALSPGLAALCVLMLCLESADAVQWAPKLLHGATRGPGQHGQFSQVGKYHKDK